MVGRSVGPPIIGGIVGNIVGEKVGEKAVKESGLDRAAGQVSLNILPYWLILPAFLVVKQRFWQFGWPEEG